MPKAIANPNDIIGNKYGKLTVDKYIGIKQSGRNRNHLYECHCDCGNTGIIAFRNALLKGDKKSCGCAHKDAGLSIKENLIGQRFGRWTVIDEAPNKVSKSGKTRSIMWKCKCDCGTVKDVRARALKTGMSTSCGCLQKERVSQALTKHDEMKRQYAKDHDIRLIEIPYTKQRYSEIEQFLRDNNVN